MSTPRGQHVQVTLERISTGGTRHQAQFERASTGPMSGAERMKKQRARCSLFPETQASAREKDAERVAARRTAAGERSMVLRTPFRARSDHIARNEVRYGRRGSPLGTSSEQTLEWAKKIAKRLARVAPTFLATLISTSTG